MLLILFSSFSISGMEQGNSDWKEFLLGKKIENQQGLLTDNAMITRCCEKMLPLAKYAAIYLVLNYWAIFCHELGHKALIKLLFNAPSTIHISRFGLNGGYTKHYVVRNGVKSALVSFAGPIAGALSIYIPFKVLNIVSEIYDNGFSVQNIQREMQQSLYHKQDTKMRFIIGWLISMHLLNLNPFTNGNSPNDGQLIVRALRNIN